MPHFVNDYPHVVLADLRSWEVEEWRHGRFHSIEVPVDHEQHPVVGEEVPAYRQ